MNTPKICLSAELISWMLLLFEHGLVTLVLVYQNKTGITKSAKQNQSSRYESVSGKYFSYFSMKICCEYSLEVPSQGFSNEYNICFHGEIRTILILFGWKKYIIWSHQNSSENIICTYPRLNKTQWVNILTQSLLQNKMFLVQHSNNT